MSDISDALKKLRKIGYLTDKDLQALQSTVDELEGTRSGSESYFSYFSHHMGQHTAHTHATPAPVERDAGAPIVEGLDE